eukprot:2883626-Pleurochrysis_carterae.AAC.3
MYVRALLLLVQRRSPWQTRRASLMRSPVPCSWPSPCPRRGSSHSARLHRGLARHAAAKDNARDTSTRRNECARPQPPPVAHFPNVLVFALFVRDFTVCSARRP